MTTERNISFELDALKNIKDIMRTREKKLIGRWGGGNKIISG